MYCLPDPETQYSFQHYMLFIGGLQYLKLPKSLKIALHWVSKHTNKCTWLEVCNSVRTLTGSNLNQIFANVCHIMDCHILSTISQTVYKMLQISYNFTVTVSI